MKISEIKDPALRALAEKRSEESDWKDNSRWDTTRLFYAFDWEQTPEGYSFWFNVDKGEKTSLSTEPAPTTYNGYTLDELIELSNNHWQYYERQSLLVNGHEDAKTANMFTALTNLLKTLKDK